MSELLLQLHRREIPHVCQQPDGRICREPPHHFAILYGAFNPLHEGHLQLAATAAKRLRTEVLFELTIRNADKPVLTIEETERRMRQFQGRGRLLLTQASTFAERAKLFHGTTWIVGADTAERVVQKRFYGNSEYACEVAMMQIRESGCRFLEAGRVDRMGRFMCLSELEIPPAYRDLFDAIPEDEFRIDISSTKLRQSL